MIPLRREHAPISAEAWNVIDEQAKTVLRTYLAARKLLDFDGPHGWAYASVSLGRSEPLASALVEDMATRLRRVQPLVELCVPFQLSREELDAVARGAADPDLDPLIRAARRIATAEDKACFSGYAAAGIRGLVEGSIHETLSLHEDYTAYPEVIANAIVVLRQAGVDGPYAIALGTRCYMGLQKATGPGGYPVLQHVQRILDGPVVWAPALEGAIVLSMRGGDYQLVVGQDISIGYASHDDRQVRLYLLESMTFRLLAPEAVVPLRYPG